ncbi:MAG: RNA pseudouridine synthase [Clostridia bacterium]|nr:RNA pseudouridine synthase [Clostridia bacterium]
MKMNGLWLSINLLGLPIHPSRLHYTDSLSNGIKFYFDSIGLAKKIRPINRLDLDTSGLVLFAKCEYIQECFIQQMKHHIFQKEYWCFIDGFLPEKTGSIQLPIARKKGSIIERCVDEINGQLAITHYKVLKVFPTFSLIQCKLETGRTHQIRVHLASLGHSLIR